MVGVLILCVAGGALFFGFFAMIAVLLEERNGKK